eukprot:TRINITY_DN9654_c0_g1_i1.p1 TRINITY_DN9654_c0_g1~~TRINITY_DN9654_c0_g1_i1.p1  ORF type:complete len:1004 (+),score=206.33 TRINITY_DN9654_c0_g1_i1:30-3014(+)
MEGEILKRGGFMGKVYQKRYAVLAPNGQLLLYKDKQKKQDDHYHAIGISGAVIYSSADKEFVVSTGQHTFELKCESKDEKDQWLKALHTAATTPAKRQVGERPTTGAVVVTHFGFKGRATIPLLVCEVGGQPYVSEVLDEEQWRIRKPNTPFGQLPVLKDGAITIGDTTAIVKYLGNKLGMNGQGDRSEWYLTKAMEISDLFREVVLSADRKIALSTLFSEKLPPQLEIVENRLKEDGVPSGRQPLTIGDIALFSTLDFVYDLEPQKLEQYSTAHQFYKATLSRPSVEKFFKANPFPNILKSEGRPFFAGPIRIVVVGASGNVGAATIELLTQHYSNKCTVTAAVRDPASASANKLRELGADVVEGDLSKPATLENLLKSGFDHLFVVTPPAKNRGELIGNAISAVESSSSLKLVVVLSFATTPEKGSLFGRQGAEIEEITQKCKLPYVILRLPMFIDNAFGNIQTIREQSKFYGPNKPDAKTGAISVRDIANAAAHILLERTKRHFNKTYRLNGIPYSNSDLAAAFSAALGRKIEYVQVPYEAAKQAMLAAGYLQDWQVDGVIELLRLQDEGHPLACEGSPDYQEVTGSDPTNIADWVQSVATAFGSVMRAVVHTEYGGVDVMRLANDIPRPSIVAPDQVLVRVVAAGLNPIDYIRRNGYIQSMKKEDWPVVMGYDLAGVVQDVGSGVTNFKHGDFVYGNVQPAGVSPVQFGTFAEYCVTTEAFLARLPEGVTFVEAAGLGVALETAIQGFDLMDLKESPRILVTGGAGGVGTLAIQVAKHMYHASFVASTSSTAKLETVRGFGADKVVDYTKEDFTTILGADFDGILDTTGDGERAVPLLRPGATVITIKAPPQNTDLPIRFFACLANGSHLARAEAELAAGSIRPIVAQAFPVEQFKEAFQLLETGRVVGKVILQIGEGPSVPPRKEKPPQAAAQKTQPATGAAPVSSASGTVVARPAVDPTWFTPQRVAQKVVAAPDPVLEAHTLSSLYY